MQSLPLRSEAGGDSPNTFGGSDMGPGHRVAAKPLRAWGTHRSPGSWCLLVAGVNKAGGFVFSLAGGGQLTLSAAESKCEFNVASDADVGFPQASSLLSLII